MLDIISDAMFVIGTPVALYCLVRICIVVTQIRDMIFWKEK